MVTLLTLSLGCGTGGLFGDGGKDPGANGEAPAPSITLTSPLPSEQRYGSTLEAAFDVENFTLDESAMGGAPVEGRGHVHAYIDGVLVGETGANSWTFTDVPTGDHTLEVRLATNDHVEMWEGSWVWLQTRNSRVSILEPADGSLLTASSAPLSLQIDDFEVTPEVAFGDPKFGAGRYVVEVDGVDADLGVDTATAQISQLAEGPHEIAVELVTADGMPLDPPARDTINVEVAPAAPYVAIDRAPYLDEHASATVPLAISAVNLPLSYHLYVDGAYAAAGTDPNVTLGHVASGYHLIELKATDGGSELPIGDHLNLFVAPGRPDVTITHPGDQWGVPAAFDLSVLPENFTLDAASMGGVPVPGTGHWSVAVDGVTVAESAGPTVSLSGLASGPRTLRVQLENNDHTPLDPPVYTEIHVTVE